MDSLEPIKVSVLVTAYNVGPYLAQCLDSIISQKVNFKYEILVADDCSTDNTASVLKKYSQNHSDLIRSFYNAANKGVAPNLCNLIELANGELLAQIDGDDFLIDQFKLQSQVDIMNRNTDCVMSFHNYAVVDSIGKNPRNNAAPFNDDCILPGNYILEKQLGPGNVSIIRRSALPEVLPEWLPKCGYQIDYIIQALAATDGKIYYSNNIMSAYRKHPQSITTITKNRFVFEMMIFNVERMATYYSNKGLNEDAKSLTSLLPRRYMVLGYHCLWQREIWNFLHYFLKGFFMKPDFSLKSHKDMIYTVSPDFAQKIKHLFKA